MNDYQGFKINKLCMTKNNVLKRSDFEESDLFISVTACFSGISDFARFGTTDRNRTNISLAASL